MSDYLTIKEACELTSKSDKTIRRHIIDVREELNLTSQLTSQDPIVTRQMSKYYILKSYLIEYYNLVSLDKNVQDRLVNVQDVTSQTKKEEGNLLITSSEKTVKKNKNTSKNNKFTNKYISHLENQISVKDEQIKELTRQSDQSQRLIAQLQQTNSNLLLGERETKQTYEITNANKESVWWVIVSLILLVTVFGGLYYMLYN